MKRVIFILLVLLLLVSGCADKEEKQKDYEKCTNICSSVLSDDFVTLELCRQECKKKFLEKSEK